ncbi:Arabinanase/levansucrase/invertase [Rhizodiscina lignyota]|uniref:Arabinanase/levansucrase/invertase n=1 Tax=Rhizodiscina lignyota TaxID=1504668 RepID=A0A9P4I7D0_9PEZI|nr:Arabinanase/levansucrase/invertase [Rhizodiscina lignyota]
MLASFGAIAFAAITYLPFSLCQSTLTADGIASMGNNSLFTRWRPVAHFIAPAGWMNDPCGPMYDSHTETYHLFYQWHPQHINWGNISWGHATSKDLVDWVDVGGWQDSEALALGPGPVGSYDGLGIFSGTAQPVNLHAQSDGNLTIFYTSVSKLPIGWNIPYQTLSETQSIATSSDGGRTWQKYEGNPVIDSDPPWNVTGFRDPFLEPLPELDAILDKGEPHYYAVFGSGIRGVGPRIPLYSAPASDLTKWSFESALWEPAANSSLGSVLETGSYGFNFEVSGFFDLQDSKGDTHWFVNMGTEGGNVTFHESAHWALWNMGAISRRANGSAEFTPQAGGAVYAITSFLDSKNGNRRIQWGWAPEDLPGTFALTQQGFQGCFALPRHLFVHEKKGIVNPPSGLGNSKYVKDSDETYTAYTLGARPLDEVVDAIRQGGNYDSIKGGQWQGSQHMSLTVTLSKVEGTAGIYIAQSPDGQESTAIYYSPGNHTIQVDRSKSSLLNPNVTFDPVVGYFMPYTTSEGEEDIVMNIFLDGSLLEVYVNDRFSLTTRIYPARTDSTGYGTYLGKGASAQFSDTQAWIGLKDVWPERPSNSSSPLLWDTAQETDNYVWWTGNKAKRMA